MAESCDDKGCVKVSQNRVSGFSKYSHKVNERFERKVELLMGGQHRPSVRQVKNRLTHLANLSWRRGGRGGGGGGV